MASIVQELGDSTSREVKPDFESGKGYYWMKQVYQARINGATGNLPRKPRRTLAEHSFFEQVDRRLSRQSFSVDIAFDKDGRRIHSG
jgi:hypothetical protein